MSLDFYLRINIPSTDENIVKVAQMIQVTDEVISIDELSQYRAWARLYSRSNDEYSYLIWQNLAEYPTFNNHFSMLLSKEDDLVIELGRDLNMRYIVDEHVPLEDGSSKDPALMLDVLNYVFGACITLKLVDFIAPNQFTVYWG